MNFQLSIAYICRTCILIMFFIASSAHQSEKKYLAAICLHNLSLGSKIKHYDIDTTTIVITSRLIESVGVITWDVDAP